MRWAIYMIAGLILLASCRSTTAQRAEYWMRQVEAPDPEEVVIAEQVSLIRLIANPQDFDGRYVMVFGYLHREFERDRIFLRKEDCDRWLDTNSIAIGVSRGEMERKMDQLSDRYVLLVGKFYYNKGVSVGTLWRVTRVEPHLTPEESIKLMKEESPNPPLQTPTSGTPAASASAEATADRGAPVAPPPGAAGR